MPEDKGLTTVLTDHIEKAQGLIVQGHIHGARPVTHFILPSPRSSFLSYPKLVRGNQ